MSTIIVLAGSPSATSRTVRLSRHIGQRLTESGHTVRVIPVRELSATALLSADTKDPGIAAVIANIADADGIVVASPVYKASYSGVLKTLLDLLPQFALADKVVLPILTGGTTAHVLALDYALRPVLTSLGADHIVPGWFVLDKHIEVHADGITLEPGTTEPLHTVVDRFSAALNDRATLAVTG
jgi:FMN reductase